MGRSGAFRKHDLSLDYSTGADGSLTSLSYLHFSFGGWFETVRIGQGAQ